MEVWIAYLLVAIGMTLLCTGTTLALAAILEHRLVVKSQNLSYLKPVDLGSSVIVAFIVATPITAKIRPLAGDREEVLVVLTVLAVLLVVELVGSLRGMLPSWHLGAEISAAVVIWSTGMGVALVSSAIVNILLTVLWFVVIINAFSLMDHPVGLASGTTVITCLTLFAIASTNGQILVSTLTIGLAGCSFGFCIAILRNQRQLMGSGSIRVVGFLVAFLSIQIDGPVNREESVANALLPLVILSFVLFNLFLSLAVKFVAKSSRSSNGGAGFSDQLIVTGLSPITLRNIHYSLMSVVAVLSYIIHRLDSIVGPLFVGMIGITYVGCGLFFIRVFLNTENENLDVADYKQN